MKTFQIWFLLFTNCFWFFLSIQRNESFNCNVHQVFFIWKKINQYAKVCNSSAFQLFFCSFLMYSVLVWMEGMELVLRDEFSPIIIRYRFCSFGFASFLRETTRLRVGSENRRYFILSTSFLRHHIGLHSFKSAFCSFIHSDTRGSFLAQFSHLRYYSCSHVTLNNGFPKYQRSSYKV